MLPAGPWPRVACGVSGDRLCLSSPLRPPGVGGAWAESYISTALWLSPSKSKEASKDQGNRPPMQRADDGDSGCDPGEGRTGVPGEELGQQKQQLAVVTFFSSWRQL